MSTRKKKTDGDNNNSKVERYGVSSSVVNESRRAAQLSGNVRQLD